jgi:hypothetical protein
VLGSGPRAGRRERGILGARHADHPAQARLGNSDTAHGSFQDVDRCIDDLELTTPRESGHRAIEDVSYLGVSMLIAM